MNKNKITITLSFITLFFCTNLISMQARFTLTEARFGINKHRYSLRKGGHTTRKEKMALMVLLGLCKEIEVEKKCQPARDSGIRKSRKMVKKRDRNRKVKAKVKKRRRSSKRLYCDFIYADGTPCENSYTDDSNLRRHIRKQDHYINKHERFCCDFVDEEGEACKRSYKTEGNLEQHKEEKDHFNYD